MPVSALDVEHPGRDAKDVDPASIVIVGGGFSGAALAYHLLRQRGAQLRVTIVERGAQLGRGVAYAAQHPALRLNVPAGHMSLDPRHPDAFVQFARAHGHAVPEPQTFLPRALYGQYVEASLRHMQRRGSARLRVVRGEASAIEAGRVKLRDGRTLSARRIVLATGLAAQGGKLELPSDPRIVDAWDEAACQRVAHGAGRTLLVGAGLSALDVFSLCEAAPAARELIFLSHHGLLPRPHAATSGTFELPARLGPAPTELLSLVRWGRAVIASAEAAGVPWQHAVDALRPRLPRLWQGLSVRDRLRFVRRVRPYWEVMLHRAPRDVLDELEARRARGEVRVLAGRVLDCRATPDALELTLRLRGGERRVEEVQHVVRCVGPALALDPNTTPLIASLFAAGLAQRDPTGLGLATDERGRVIDARGQPSDRLFALGQLCRPARWETTSVPEIVRDVLTLLPLMASDAPRARAP